MSTPTVAAPTAAELAGRIDRAAIEMAFAVGRSHKVPVGTDAYHREMDRYAQWYGDLLIELSALQAMAERAP